MKILFVINSLKYKSGIERAACLLANLFFEKLGCEIVIANRDTNKDNVAYDLDANIDVLKISGSYYNFYKGLNKELRINPPDVIFVHNMGRLSLLCSMLSIGAKTKFITLEHVAFDIRPLWVKFLSKLVYRKISQVVTLTKKDMQTYERFHKNINKINNISPFNVDGLEYAKKSKTIISIGRLTYQKNFESLLKAWTIVSKEMPDWNLEIYGIGEKEQQLRQNIFENNLKNVYLKGQTSEVESIYRTAALYVMSSRFEGLPMVLIEAQSFGLPIVSYDCPHGPAEIIENNKTGFLVENQNIDILARCMLKLMSSESLRVKFSNNARNHAIAYSEEEILKEWIKVIN